MKANTRTEAFENMLTDIGNIVLGQRESGEDFCIKDEEETFAEIKRLASQFQPSQPKATDELADNFKTGWKHGFKQGALSILPDNNEVENWFTENIDAECSASSGIFKFRQWLKERSKPQPKAEQQETYVKQLEEVLNAFKWTHDNMGEPYTPDHFNIPANGIEQLKQVIEWLSKSPTTVREGQGEMIPAIKIAEARNRLYDKLPATGEIKAFDLITIISNHLKELDALTPTPPPGE